VPKPPDAWDYLARIEGQLRHLGVWPDEDPWRPHEFCHCMGYVDAVITFPGLRRSDLRLIATEFVDTRISFSDPREEYVYQLIVNDRSALGWHRHAEGPHAFDHEQVYDADENVIARHPIQPVTLPQVIERVSSVYGLAPPRRSPLRP
jgi:hypothetical protein